MLNKWVFEGLLHARDCECKDRQVRVPIFKDLTVGWGEKHIKDVWGTKRQTLNMIWEHKWGLPHPEWVNRKGRVRESLMIEVLRWKKGNVCQGRIMAEAFKREQITYTESLYKGKKNIVQVPFKECKLLKNYWSYQWRTRSSTVVMRDGSRKEYSLDSGEPCMPCVEVCSVFFKTMGHHRWDHGENVCYRKEMIKVEQWESLGQWIQFPEETHGTGGILLPCRGRRTNSVCRDGLTSWMMRSLQALWTVDSVFSLR